MKLAIPTAAQPLLRGYAAIMFCEHPLIGLAFMAVTFWNPWAGATGLVSAITGFLLARRLRLPVPDTGGYVYNCLLVGLALGVAHAWSPAMMGLVICAAVLTTFLTAILTDWLWRWDHLPALSMPFVLVATLANAAASGFAPSVSASGLPLLSDVNLFSDSIGAFLAAMGSPYFTPYALPGLVIFLGLLWTSRYLAFLAICGFVVGQVLFLAWAPEAARTVGSWANFNFILTALALGGTFMAPSVRSFLLAMLGVALAALLLAAGHHFSQRSGLSVLAVPFLAATLFTLAAMRKRTAASHPLLLLEYPALPEINFERTRLAQARGITWDSVPLSPPFYGEWQVYQGFDGAYTHRDSWRHALDFYIHDGKSSYQGTGRTVADYHCFGLPVLAPASGQILRCRDDLPDVPPGEADTQLNWGNYVLIRMASGLCVLVAHLRQGSLKVRSGEAVWVGTMIGECGSSGRSPQPHIHLQVQSGEALGSPTHPFHLSCVLTRRDREAAPELALHRRPEEGESVAFAANLVYLQRALHLPADRLLSYEVSQGPGQPSIQRTLRTWITLTGQFRLTADSGASAAYEETFAVFACYDRNRVADRFLDLWLLAQGFTPFSETAYSWRDSPPMQLLPVNLGHRCALALRYPLGGGLHSHYSRSWDTTSAAWLQVGEHRLLGERTLTTRAWISPEHGCTRWEAKWDEHLWSAQLSSNLQDHEPSVSM
ncbi:MAG: urea transporter [Burkholderiales bacterium]